MAAGKRAKDWMYSGWMTDPSKYTQMYSNVAAAGGGAGDLEGVLERAVRSGVESAKNLEDLGTSITTMAQSLSATYGVKSIEGVAGITTDVMAQQTKLYGMDPNLATSVAADAAKYDVEKTRQTGVTPGSLYFMNEMKKMGLSTKQALTLGQLPAETVEAMIKDPEARKRFGMENLTETQLKRTVTTKGAAMAIGAGGILGGTDDIQKIVDFGATGKKFDAKDIALWSVATQGSVAGQAAISARMGYGAPMVYAPPPPVGTQEGKGRVEGVLPTSERTRAAMETKEALSFNKSVEQFGTSTKMLMDAMQHIVQSKNFQQLAESGKEAAETRSTTPGTFSEMKTYNGSIETSAKALTAAAANLAVIAQKLGGTPVKMASSINTPNQAPNLYNNSQSGTSAPGQSSGQDFYNGIDPNMMKGYAGRSR
jgi:hypothetical protein